jgi:thiosulfate reductase cytochrome b subunit
MPASGAREGRYVNIGRMARQLELRHPWPVRLWHWVTASAIGVLLLTGLLLFDIHPRLYWGDDGHEGMPAFFSISAPDLDRPVLQTDLQVGNHHFDMTGRLGLAIDTGFGDKDFLVFPPPDDWDFGATRGWHFLCAWILVLGAFAYGLYLLASGRLRRMLWPARTELTFASVGRELSQHLRLRRAHGEAARRYNLLQKLSYLVVIFGLIPLLIVSGLTMSNSVTTAFPDLFTLFGGRQSARSIHFIAAMLLLAFILVHVFQVFVAGFFNLMRSMITGRFAVEPEESP